VVLVPNPQHHPQGDFILNPQGIVGSGPVDLSNAASLSYTFAGIGVYSPKLFAALPVGTVAPLGPLLRQAMNLGAVTGELHTGLWVDVGTPQRLANLETLLLRTSHPSQFGV
jgi:MurNAc alpha-1-phosphate uridylyltransferase